MTTRIYMADGQTFHVEEAGPEIQDLLVEAANNNLNTVTFTVPEGVGCVEQEGGLIELMFDRIDGYRELR